MDEGNGSSSNTIDSDEQRHLQSLMNQFSISSSPRPNFDYNNFISGDQEPQNLLIEYKFKGLIHMMAKDPDGSPFLVRKIIGGNANEIAIIIAELVDHVHDLMLDRYGNDVINKIFYVCNKQQFSTIFLRVIDDRGNFLRVCIDAIGSNTIHNLLDHVTMRQMYLFVLVLKSIIVFLSKSCYGHRVILHCLELLSKEDNEILMDGIAEHCFEIASDKVGCYLLKSSMDHAWGVTRWRIITQITSNALVLSEHPYGNYAVQNILQMGSLYVAANIIAQLKGHYVMLSMNKYASNVVEKCLLQGGHEHSSMIILELINSPQFLNVVQDDFGNYVIQSALLVSKGATNRTLVDIIQANYALLHTHPHGNKVLDKLKKLIGDRSRHRTHLFRRNSR